MGFSLQENHYYVGTSNTNQENKLLELSNYQFQLNRSHSVSYLEL